MKKILKERKGAPTKGGRVVDSEETHAKTFITVCLGSP